MKIRTEEHDFDWDEPKASLNLSKHGVSFPAAATVFEDPLHSTQYDWLHSDDEDRWITLGLTVDGQLLAVVHTYTEALNNTASIRVISARRANRHECITYERRSHMIRDEAGDDGLTDSTNAKQFFRGGHVTVDKGVRRMSIFLDYELLKYFLIRAATLDEAPTDLIDGILRRERARLESEKIQAPHA